VRRVPAIEARGWGFRYAGRQAWAVRGLHLRVEEGERVLLAGASGSGKSTLLAGLAGLLEEGAGETEGQLLVRGRHPARCRDDTGLLFQDPASQLVMARAGDEIAFPLENRCIPRAELWTRVDLALAASGLGVGREHPTDALSGGEQQRLALAAVLSAAPRLLLLDEPTASLDVAAARDLRQRLAPLGDGLRTLVFVEHRAEELLDQLDRVIALDGPRGIIADGGPAAVFTRDRASLDAAGIWVPGVRLEPRRGTLGERSLEARGLTYRHPAGDRDAPAGVDLDLHAGEAVAVTGPNGSGKTTLVLLMGGLLRPTRGTALVSDPRARRVERELWRMPARALVRRVGSVFQDPAHQFLRERVDREIETGPLHAGTEPAEARRLAHGLMERLGLGHVAAANPFTLSGGEQRRLSIATALATSPSALLLDEPTFGQDRRGHADLLSLLDAFRGGGGALLFATHDTLLVQALADREQRLAA